MDRVIFCAVFALAFGVVSEVEAQGTNTVCRIRVVKKFATHWRYEVEECSTGTTATISDQPHLSVGGDCTNPGGACVGFPEPLVANKVYFSKSLDPKLVEKIKERYRREARELFSQLAGVVNFARREIYLNN